jgi:hypothetical protein
MRFSLFLAFSPSTSTTTMSGVAEKSGAAKHIPLLLRIIGPFVSGVLALILPFDSIRFVFSNMLHQLFEYAAKYFENAKSAPQACLIVPALAVSFVPNGAENLTALLSSDFKAIEAYLTNNLVETTTQKLYTASGSFASITFQSEPYQVQFAYCQARNIVVGAAEKEDIDSVVLLNFRVQIVTALDQKNVEYLLRPQSLDRVTARISFANAADEKRCTASANACFNAVLRHIVELQKSVDSDEDDLASESLSTLQLLQEKGGVKLRRRLANGYTNSLFTDLLTFMSSLDSDGTIEAERLWGSVSTFAALPKEPISFITSKFGKISAVYVDESILSGSGDAAPIIVGPKREETNAICPEYMFVTSDLGLAATMAFLTNVSERLQSGSSALWEKTQKVFTIHVNNLNGVGESDKKQEKTGAISWLEKRYPITRTRQNSAFTRQVEESVFTALEDIQSRRQEYNRVGINTRVNFLLEGPPGTGKSTIPLVVANMLGNIPLVCFSFAAVQTGAQFLCAVSALESLLPVSEPYVCQIDDLEKSSFFKSFSNDSNESNSNNSGSSSCDIATFLNWIDGVGANANRVLFVSVNDLSLLKQVDEQTKGSLLRDGRLNPIVHVGTCDADQFAGFYRNVFQCDIEQSALESIECCKFTVAQLQRLVISANFDSQRFLSLCLAKSRCQMS